MARAIQLIQRAYPDADEVALIVKLVRQLMNNDPQVRTLRDTMHDVLENYEQNGNLFCLQHEDETEDDYNRWTMLILALAAIAGQPSRQTRLVRENAWLLSLGGYEILNWQAKLVMLVIGGGGVEIARALSSTVNTRTARGGLHLLQEAAGMPGVSFDFLWEFLRKDWAFSHAFPFIRGSRMLGVSAHARRFAEIASAHDVRFADLEPTFSTQERARLDRIAAALAITCVVDGSAFDARTPEDDPSSPIVVFQDWFAALVNCWPSAWRLAIEGPLLFCEEEEERSDDNNSDITSVAMADDDDDDDSLRTATFPSNETILACVETQGIWADRKQFTQDLLSAVQAQGF